MFVLGAANILANYLIKISLVIITCLIFSSSYLEAAKKKDKKEKDCIYCKKFEKMKDWPLEERPKAFIYEEVNYPKGMFSKQTGKKSKTRQAAAGKKVYARFVKGKVNLININI